MKIRFESPPSSPQIDTDLAVKYAASKRKVPRWRWYLLMLSVLALPAYFGLHFISELFWVHAPGFVMMNQMDVKAGTSGRIAFCLQKGSEVQAGRPLILLAPPIEIPQIPAAKPLHTVPPEQIRAARATLALNEQELTLRQHRLDVMRRLMDQGAATVADVATAQEQWLAAQAQAIRARTELDSALQPSPQGIAPSAQPAPLPASSAAIAPIAGRIIQMFVHTGAWVERDTDVAIIRSPGEPSIQAFLDPADMRYAKPGQRATLVFDDGRRVDAVVTGTEPDAQKIPADRVSPLEARQESIVVNLRPLVPLPEAYRVSYLPLLVRFDLSIPSF